MKTAIVTGANGFIGRYVSYACAEHGIYVIGIGHGDWTKETQKQWGVAEWHEVDVSLSTLLAHGQMSPLIFHCAGSGSVGYSFENPAEDFERTVSTTREVLEYIRTCAPDTVLVYPSSAAVYGQSSVPPIPESATLAPVSPYGVHKKIAEDLCRSYGDHFGIRSAVIRIFSAYGPELRKQLLWDACRKISAATPTFSGTGNERRDWVNVRDVAALMLIASRHATPSVPVLNCATGNGITIRETVNLLAETMNCRQTPTFDGIQRSGDPARLFGNNDASRAIGWEPRVTLREGIEEYVKWFLGLSDD